MKKIFFIVALADVNDGGTPYMGISPGRTRPCTHRKSKSTAINTARYTQAALLHGTRSGRLSLKKCVFGCEGKITFSFPKNPALSKLWMQFVFPGQQMSFSSVVCLRTFYKQGLVRRWICAKCNTERCSSPSYKRSRSWFWTADSKWNGITCLCSAGDRAQVLVTL